MFLQEVPNQGTTLTPMTGNTRLREMSATFQAIPSASSHPGAGYIGDFGSVYFSPTMAK